MRRVRTREKLGSRDLLICDVPQSRDFVYFARIYNFSKFDVSFTFGDAVTFYTICLYR